MRRFEGLVARLPGPGDAAALCEVHRRVFSPPQLSPDYWQGGRAEPPALCVAVEEEGRILSYCDGFLAGGEGDIVSIGTLPMARGRGAGRLALSVFLAEAAARNADVIHLEVGEGNVPARRLYEALGFEQTGRRPRYYTDGSDALIFSRRAALAVGSGRD